MGYKLHSNEEEKKLVEEYIQGAPVKILMEKYGYKTKKSITDKVKKYASQSAINEARKNRKNYSINFDGVTSEFNAYFLGLMLTDGYICDENKFGIDLTDEDCIQFLSKITNKEYKTYDPGTEKGKKNRYRLIFSDAEIVKTLAKYEVISNKSNVLKGPILTINEQKFLPYLIRGIIDGDGCIYQTSYGAPAFYVCSNSKQFLEWLKDVFENKFFFQDMCLNQTPEGMWRLDTAYQLNILKLISIVYNKPYGMNRKYELIRKMFRDYNKDNLLLG